MRRARSAPTEPTPDGMWSLRRLTEHFVERAEITEREHLGPAYALPLERPEGELVTREDWNTLVRFVRRRAGV